MQSLIGSTRPLASHRLFPPDLNSPAVPSPLTRFTPGSPMARMRDAAERGDLNALHSQVVAARRDLSQLRTATEDADIETLLALLEKLGIAAGFVADVAGYVALAKASIGLVNGFLGVAGVFLNNDAQVVAGSLNGDGPVPQLAVVRLSASVSKQSKGLVFLDNVERIDTAEVTFEVLQGPPASLVQLSVVLRAFGIGQDSLTAALAFDEDRSNGDAAPNADVATTIDVAGLEATQISDLQRTRTTRFTVALDPAPGVVEYGINGANVAVVLEATGVATFTAGTVQLPMVRAIDLGISI